MTHVRRQLLLYGMLVILLTAAMGWAVHRCRASRAEAYAIRDALLETDRTAERIKQLKQAPSMAGSEEMQLEELARLIENAAAVAAVPNEAIQRIWPQQPRRLEDTVYKEKPTFVALRNLSMRQVVALLHELTVNDLGLRCENLRLTATREQPNRDRWDVEFTVMYLIYAPRSEEARS